DALRAADEGAAAVVVSNHGGRQLDGVLPTLRALPEVVAAVRGRTEVLVDGGIRRGSDIVKALILGARAVLVGRADAYGLGAAGGAGVTRAIEILTADLHRTLRLLGCGALSELDPSMIELPADFGRGRRRLSGLADPGEGTEAGAPPARGIHWPSGPYACASRSWWATGGSHAPIGVRRPCCDCCFRLRWDRPCRSLQEPGRGCLQPDVSVLSYRRPGDLRQPLELHHDRPGSDLHRGERNLPQRVPPRLWRSEPVHRRLQERVLHRHRERGSSRELWPGVRPLIARVLVRRRTRPSAPGWT